MSKKRKVNKAPKRVWDEWREAQPVNRLTREPAQLEPDERFVTNGLYNVHIVEVEQLSDEAPPVTWLSICRIDRKTVRDWRDLQRIKNELVGEECEAVEIYPAESRLVDTSNQFHLWVMSDSRFRFPWGFDERMVTTPEETAELSPGAVQRKFQD